MKFLTLFSFRDVANSGQRKKRTRRDKTQATKQNYCTRHLLTAVLERNTGEG
jgi:hypothetical protein